MTTLRITAAADKFGLSPQTLYTWIRSGKLRTAAI